MPIGAGFSSKTAWRKEDKQGAYGTPIACGADQQAPLISETLARDIRKEPDNVIRHLAGHGAADIVAKLVAGGVEFEAVYRGIESILASALGFCHYEDSPETVVAGVYKHSFELAENLHTESWAAGDGILAGSGYLAGDNKVRRGSLCIDKAVSIWEYISTMVQSLTISGDAKGVRLACELIPYDLDRASAVNVASTTWSIADDDWRPVLFQDLELWIDDYSAAAALTSADAVGISAFEIKLENNLIIEQDSLSGLYTAEPRRSGKRRVTGSFTFPRYEADDFLDDLDAQNPMMAMLRFSGAAIGAHIGHDRTLWIWLPTLHFDRVDAPIGGAGLLTVQHTFSAEIPAAVPAGFPATAVKELLIQLQNDYATNPLK